MRGIRARLAIASAAVGLVVLLVAPGVVFGSTSSSWPAEGPAWWNEASEEEGTAHRWSELDERAYIEPTALNATSASFDVHIKPIAGVPVTYWEVSIRAEPLCRGTEVLFEECPDPDAQEQELMRIRHYQFAEGEIVGGNPSESVEVAVSTLNGGHDGEETWAHESEEAAYGPPQPFQLLPGRVYRVFVGAFQLKNGWLENSRLREEPWLDGLAAGSNIDIFTPGTPVSNARLKREQRQAAKKLKQEQRRKKREEHTHGG